ncbi:MAG: hypothetical protein KDE14_04410, partial [Rhodobacteraceae bacterium]|nr:hypothetical protein [Paracoccaceae bacterium]
YYIKMETAEGYEAMKNRIGRLKLRPGFWVARLLIAFAALSATWFAVAAEPPRAIRVMTGTFPDAWGNPYSQSSVTFLSIWSAMFDPLVLLQTDGVLKPWLATAWEQTAPRMWRFDLREDVLFSNGEPFTAESVKVGIDYLISPQGRGEPVARDLSEIESATVLGPHAIEIKVKDPDPLLPRKLSMFRVVAPQRWRELGPAGFGKDPAGTGPYRMAVNRATEATLDAVPTSWRRAPIARLEVLKTRDAATRRAALLSHRADLAVGGAIGIDDIAEVEAAGFKMFVDHVPAVVAMVFNTVRDSPFRDIRVREAVSLAVDRPAIVEAFLGDYSSIASQPSRRAAFGHNAGVAPLPYDPERARALLAEAGYPDGFTFETEIPGGTVIYVNVFQKVAEDLARVGVTMVLQSIPPQVFLSNIQTGEWRGAAMAIPFYSPVNDALYPMRQHSCLWPAPWYCDPVAADMFLDASREPDLDTRRVKTEAIMARAADQRQAMFMYETIQFGAYADWMTGFKSDLGFIHYEDIEARAPD